MLAHEIPIVEAIQSFRTPLLDQIFYALNVFDSDITYLVIVIILWHMISEKLGFRLLYLQVMGTMGYISLKDLFAQPRPYELVPSLKVLGTTGYGFPSGAATEAALTFGFIFFISQSYNIYYKTVALVLIFLAGLTRVYLGAHFPTDIIGGYALAAAILYGYSQLQKPIEKKLHNASRLYVFIANSVFLALVLSIHPTPGLITLFALLYGALIWHMFLYPLTDGNVDSFSFARRCLTTVSAFSGMFLLDKVITLMPLYVHPVYHTAVHAFLNVLGGIWLGASSYVYLLFIA